jgi:hypothetical protein
MALPTEPIRLWISRTILSCTTFAIFAAACATETKPLSDSGAISGPPDNVRRLSEAISAADSVYCDPHFWEMVSERDWIAAPDAQKAIPGAAVADALRDIRPSDQIYQFKRFGFGHLPFVRGGTTASTAACQLKGKRCGSITVNIKDDDDVFSLVNTVAHETTHTIGNDLSDGTRCHCTRDTNFAFSDTPSHPLEKEVWLVSYSLGDLAECYYKTHGDHAQTWDCFYQYVDGARCDRHAIECNGPPTQVVAGLRASTHRCSGSELSVAALTSCR